MKKIRSALLILVVLILSLCCILPACKNEESKPQLGDYNGLYFGIYYAEGDEDSYIAIKADKTAFLNNLDFSDFDPEIWWGNQPEWESGLISKDEVDAAMHGEKEYWYFKSGLLCFEIKSVDSLVYQISFHYNGTDELEFNGTKYILNKEISMNRPIATIEMENGGKITLELYPDKAPNTVNNFISLANSGFYDGIIFHRVIKGFMIQGGDPAGVGTGGPGYHINGEFSLNGFKGNDIKHERGVISMARAYNPNSAGSQFFIMHANASYLDGQYAAFGRVVEGMDVVDQIASVATDVNDKPKTAQTMKKVTVETFGIAYPAPQKAR